VHIDLGHADKVPVGVGYMGDRFYTAPTIANFY
jgi:hypothetical protein